MLRVLVMLILPQSENWPSQYDPLKAGGSLKTLSVAARQVSHPNVIEIWGENSTPSGGPQ